MFNILASVAQEESRQLGERISATWAHITSQGWHRTTLAPWGLSLATSNRRGASPPAAPRSVIDVDTLAAPHVAEAFASVAAGESTRSVADRLAALPDDARGGYAVTRRTVQDALRNPVDARYRTRQRPRKGAPLQRLSAANVMAQPRTRWPAIVDAEIWHAVQNRLDRRKVSKASGRYLLTGLLRCPACAGPMHGES